MAFSVLMSLYAKENPEYLRQSLNSIFSQTLKPDEVILVEDGPITVELDAVVSEYAEKHPEMKIVPLPVNGGLGNALNEGLKHCSHELVARMDTDDISKPERFQTQVRYMESHPEIDISSAWIEEFEDEISNVKSIKKVPLTHEEISGYIGLRNPLNHPAVIFRKGAVEKAGGYQHFHLFEDWYLWARMYVAGCHFANIDKSVLYFRISPQMFKRRGGVQYAADSARFQWKLHQMGIISKWAAIKSSVLRGSVYLMPNNLRKFVYSKILRS